MNKKKLKKFQKSNKKTLITISDNFQQDVKFIDNKAVFFQLNHHMVISKFLKGFKRRYNQGVRSMVIDFSNVNAQVFPNVAVPLCAIISYYESHGMEFTYNKVPHFLENMQLLHTIPYSDEKAILNKVWGFSSENVGKIVDAYIEELSHCDTFPKGFLTATEWALNEVMDNVIQHSNVTEGFVMGQVHPTTKHIAFTVFDLGQGIYNSFNGSNYHPRNSVDAITLSLQESITRDKSVGQGNGLFGLSSLIKQGDSRLKITSGRGYYSYAYGKSSTFEDCPIISDKVCMTTVDFMLDYSSDVSIEKALVFNGKVYTPISLRIENLEDINGNIRIQIKNESNGTGTRQAALKIKNQILNILSESPKHIIVDFSGVSVISSSYADELIAKLFCTLGLFQFNRLIKIVGLTDEQQLILQKSVIQRIVEDYNQELESNE